MSSRSLATARAKRAGDAMPTVSGTRPGTSIHSQSAFAYARPPPQPQQQPPSGRNANSRPLQQQQQQYQQVQQQYQQVQQQVQQQQPKTPKISIPAAIGLITIRLGRVEQWIVNTEHDQQDQEQDQNQTQTTQTHAGSRVDPSVLTALLQRIQVLEKSIPTAESNPTFVQDLTKEVEALNVIVSKHSNELAKHTEQMLRMSRDIVETKDLVKSFMMKYDEFVQETQTNFADYEQALAEVEGKLTITPDLGEEELLAQNGVPLQNGLDTPKVPLQNGLDTPKGVDTNSESVIHTATDISVSNTSADSTTNNGNATENINIVWSKEDSNPVRFKIDL